MSLAKSVLNSAHDSAVFQRRVQVLSRWISEMIPDGETVLDVGCGDGTIAKATMAQKPELSFEGIDVFLRPSVAIPAQTYDGRTIPLADGSVDWVTIVDVLHHTDDPQTVLAECARVARRGVIIKDHLRDGVLAGPTLRFMDWVGNRGHNVRLPYNYLSKKEWLAIFDRLNLKPAAWQERGIGLYPQPFDSVFGRGLHMITRLERNSDKRSN